MIAYAPERRAGIYGLATPCLRGRLAGGAGLMAARSSAVKRFRSACGHSLAREQDKKQGFMFGLTVRKHSCRGIDTFPIKFWHRQAVALAIILHLFRQSIT